MKGFRTPLIAGLLSGAALPAIAQEYVIDAGTLFDGNQLSENARIVVQDGRVIEVGTREEVDTPEGAEVIDYSQYFIMPQMIAGHSHVGTVQGMEHGGDVYSRETVERDLAQFARYGIAAVNALGMNRPLFHELRTEMRGPDYAEADLYGAGTGLGAPDGAPPADAMNTEEDQVNRPGSPEEARESVQEMSNMGVDMIKVWIDDMGDNVPKMAPDIYTAVFEEATAQGLLSAAHIHDYADARAAIEAGVNVIAHGVRDQEIDDELITLMAENGVWYIPTININESNYLYAEHPEWLEDDFFTMGASPELQEAIADEEWREKALEDVDEDRQAVAVNIENLRRIVEHGGVRVVLGTDSGATAVRIPGFAEHQELALMAEAGMDPLDILIASTSAGADMLRIDDLGRIEPGARAQFIVIDGDPSESITDTRSIVEVIRY
ncbi:amidohydrolase family protein [Vreelandella olivaria]|uniref:amidohydrolase family protein n=1 Tax=Vreelandella olivaria TaxID=390919 RepID=UPI00201E7C45|nr:amidohydrolase family protein [Halomonas olivaria]